MRDDREDGRRDASWDVSAGGGNYATLVAGQLASAGLSLVAITMVSHALATTGYGRVVAVLALAQGVSQLALHWTALSLYRHGCEEFVETGRVASSFWNRIWLLAASGAAVGATAGIWLPAVASWLELPPQAVWLVPVHVVASAVALQVYYALLAAKLPRYQAMSAVISRALLVLALAVSLRGGVSWTTVTLLYAATPLVETLLGIARIRKLVYPGIGIDVSRMKRMLRFSLPLTVHGLLGYLVTNHLDAFFIVKLKGASALGVYSIAFQLVGTFMQLASLGGSLLLSLFVTLDVQGERERLARFFHEVLPVLVVVWTAGCILLPAVGGLVLEALFDPSFAASAELLWPLAVSAAFAGPVLLGLGPLLNARSATHLSAAMAGIAALVNVVGNAFLIPAFGLSGCAWATALAYASATGAALVLMRSLLEVPASRYLLGVLPALVAALLGPGAHAVAAGLALSLAVGLARRRSFASVLRRLSSAFAPGLLAAASPGGRRDG